RLSHNHLTTAMDSTNVPVVYLLDATIIEQNRILKERSRIFLSVCVQSDRVNNRYYYANNISFYLPLHRDLSEYRKRFDATAHALYPQPLRSEEHTSELQSRFDIVCRL